MAVPKASLGTADPPTVPAFFNPAAATNRDISVAVVASTSGRSFCDALAGVGARGVRVSNEVREAVEVTLVDINAASLALAKRSARLNGVQPRCTFAIKDANAFLWSRGRPEERFDYVDVDPFGTPAPYLQGAFNAIKDEGIVSVTATDTAVLCGVYPDVARRRYGGISVNNSFHHETAVRILANACRKVAGSLDIGVRPVLAHSTRHYVRVYLRALVGASKADQSMKGEGFVISCPKCGEVSSSSEPSRTCGVCGAKAKCAGPLWLSSIVDEELLSDALSFLEKRELLPAARTIGPLAGVGGFPPYSYSLEGICSKLKVPSVPMGSVREGLERRGFKTAPQPFESTGLKTDARFSDVLAAAKEVSG